LEDSSLHIAKQWLRLTNSIVDLIAIFILWVVIIGCLVLFGFDQVYASAQREVTLRIAWIFLPTFWIYYLVAEFFFQRTLGKVLSKTKVVTKAGLKPGFLQILGRTLSRSIPFEYLSYLRSPTGIHDILSGTRVVKE
jgi:uncharacterized RDD family membrane protein YckC